MKLVLVTAVERFHKDVIKLFKKAGIENFSESDIDGYKNNHALIMSTNWFGAENASNESTMFFSFTEEEQIERLFHLIAEFNSKIETNNPIRGVVLPIEKYI